MLSRFYLIPERYERTGGQMDRQICYSISRVSMLTRDKNCCFITMCKANSKVTHSQNIFITSRAVDIRTVYYIYCP